MPTNICCRICLFILLEDFCFELEYIIRLHSFVVPISGYLNVQLAVQTTFVTWNIRTSNGVTETTL